MPSLPADRDRHHGRSGLDQPAARRPSCGRALPSRLRVPSGNTSSTSPSRSRPHGGLVGLHVLHGALHGEAAAEGDHLAEQRHQEQLVLGHRAEAPSAFIEHPDRERVDV